MKARSGVGSFAIYGLTAAAVWLAWEIVKAPVADRAPPATAIRVAPLSPEVLRRAAEEELGAGRAENARGLATDSLASAPFNARTLRVLGLIEARDGRTDRADALLTLAGNWSLRDDPAHGWLIERRLRQGDYGSAFAHADTLARRWVDGNDRVFDLFTSAVLADRRALPALATAVARQPSWRSEFIRYLIRRPDADAAILSLGLILAESPNGYSNEELSWIYLSWYEEKRFDAIRFLRTRTGRPGGLNEIQNGDFSAPIENALLPFGWWFEPSSGISAALIEDDLRADEIALRVEYDGYASGVVAEQILMLPSGQRVLTGQERVEFGPETSRLRWRVLCVENDQTIGLQPRLSSTEKTAEWHTFQLLFVVPDTGCAVQRLRLETDPGDRRATTVAWFDKLKIATGRAGVKENDA